MESEKNYIKGLEELNNRFLLPYAKPLKEKANVDIGNFQKKVMCLIASHDNVYDKFCQAENICKSFKENLQFLRTYKYYIQDYTETLRELKGVASKRSIRSVFQYGLGTADPVQLFDDLAFTIVKRPTDYESYFKALKHYTPILHPMYRDLEKTLFQIEGICFEINDFQHRAVNQQKFSEIAKLINPMMLRELGVDKLLISARRLIHHGRIFLRVKKRLKSGTNKDNLDLEEGFVVMCNDILIITYQEYSVRRVFDVKTIKAVVNKKPKRSSKRSKEVFEVLLRNRGVLSRSEPVVEENKSSRDMARFRRSRLQSGLIDHLCIYTKTLEEAEELEKSLRYARMADIN